MTAELLAAIREAPDDDAPRMIYADWLIERGDPLGEFIQLQCLLAAAPDPREARGAVRAEERSDDNTRRRAMRIAENKLLAAHEATWIAPLLAVLPPPPSPLAGYTFEFARGFVEGAGLPVAALAALPRLRERAPLLRTLKIAPGEYPAPELSAALLAKLADIEELELGVMGGDALGLAVAATPFTRLRRLRLSSGIGREALAFHEIAVLMFHDPTALALAASPHLTTLRSLAFGGSTLTNTAIAAIARAPWRLDELSLAWTNLEPGFAKLLPPGLVTLALSGVHMAEVDIAAIAKLPALRDLDLELCQLGPEGIATFCAALRAPLERLRIERNSLNEEGALTLAGCKGLATLRSLEAGHNRFGAKGAKAIAMSPHLAGLARLTLNEPRWSPATKALLAGSETLAQTRIYLAGKLIAKDVRAKARAEKPPPKARQPKRAR